MCFRRFGVLSAIVLAISLVASAPTTFSQSPAAAASPATDAKPNLAAIDVYFSPNGGCTDAIVKELDHAQKSVLIQAYSFTSARIAKAMVDAHDRGVDVQVILDKSQRSKKYSSADFVLHAGIPVLIDAKHAIAHNKIMIIDGAEVITGSFNFTRAAEEQNAENLLVIRDKTLADKYIANWKAHAAHSDKYVGKDVGLSEMAGPASARDEEPTEQPGDAPSGGYVASKRSQVFHKPDCPEAKRILEKNLIHFDTRDDAIQSGKRPCAVCKP